MNDEKVSTFVNVLPESEAKVRVSVGRKLFSEIRIPKIVIVSFVNTFTTIGTSPVMKMPSTGPISVSLVCSMV